MTGRERLLHITAFEAARRIEEVLIVPRRLRAIRFFELFQLIKRGLEEFSDRSKEHRGRWEPGDN